MQEDLCTAGVCDNSDFLVGFANSGADLSLWLGRCAAVAPGVWTVLDEVDVVAARELRGALLTLLRAHSGCAEETAGGSADVNTSVPAAEAYLRRIAPRYPLVPQISADGCTLLPAQTGVLGVFGAILAAVTNLAYQGGWRRLKVCKNDVCHEAFFDKTRNSSGLYCSAACNSQASMRAYRSRQRAAA